MKKLTSIIALALVASIASASSPIDNIWGNCQYVMSRSPCRVALDQNDYPAGGRTLVGGVGWVANEAIVNLRATGYALTSDGTFLMCEAARSGCLQSWDSQTCRYARGQWRQTPAPTV